VEGGSASQEEWLEGEQQQTERLRIADIELAASFSRLASSGFREP
jgi:hypothetical protein